MFINYFSVKMITNIMFFVFTRMFIHVRRKPRPTSFAKATPVKRPGDARPMQLQAMLRRMGMWNVPPRWIPQVEWWINPPSFPPSFPPTCPPTCLAKL